jgi:adenylate cyclase
MTEIERKYLVASPPPNLEAHSSRSIVQGYVAIEDGGAEVRLRRKGGRYFETVKKGRGLERMEAEVELSEAQFEVLWPAVGDRQVEKTRYEIPLGDLTVELDVYAGRLAGLMTAEVEFGSVADSETFEPPPWLGAEVTEDERYKNRNLATHGLSAL